MVLSYKRRLNMFNTPFMTKRSSKYGSNYWHVFSPKMNRMIHLFSDLEYDHWLLVEGNNQIKRFCEQPKRIQVSFEGSLVTSIFDMWIESQCFIEIKYHSELDPQNPKSERSLRQTAIQRIWCKENDYDYMIQTENEIRKNPVLLDNLKEIIPYLQYGRIPNEIDYHFIMQKISKRLTIKQLREECNHLSVSRLNQTLYTLIYSGELSSTINQSPLGLTTEVWQNGI
ncbi:hypothetical protein EEL30_18455 [Brevibacillus laterosporus]|uniref:TnsA endonuclease N-terminal domain-containing protein n=1 Tax=Brevibacillus laterosporus TaxID=1465 RepID=A0A518VAS0_BRELA|nr:hypothetical protein EEL30_18455 [Brevibacillus laterosporus]